MRTRRTIKNISIAGYLVPCMEVEPSDFPECEYACCIKQTKDTYVPVYDYIQKAWKKWNIDVENQYFDVSYDDGIKMLTVKIFSVTSVNAITTICDEFGVRGDTCCINAFANKGLGIEIHIQCKKNITL